jgi:hypothetical protein
MRRVQGRCRVPALLAAAALAACIAPLSRDYEARPVAPGAAQDGRLVAERSGVRVAAGPPSEFPYAVAVAGRTRVRGRYQLFTRVRVENRRADVVEVLWPEARLEVPEGEPLGLVESVGSPDGRADAQPPAPTERLGPGQAAVRALIPESLRTIGVDEPLVRLCDGCEYRLVIPVRVAGREELLVLPFRLEARRGRDEARVLFLD